MFALGTLLFLLTAGAGFSLAARDVGIYTYVFRLYYDNGQLLADRDFEFKYDLIAEPFVQAALDTPTSYKGEVINLLGRVVGSFQFDPTATKGKISVKGPYFSDAGKVNFYNDKGELLLTLSVSDSSVCDDDSICDSDVGESYQNCPNDCKRPSPSPAYQPPVPYSIWQDPMFIGFLASAVLVVVLVVWVIIRKKRASANQNQGLPPETPLTPPIS